MRPDRLRSDCCFLAALGRRGSCLAGLIAGSEGLAAQSPRSRARRGSPTFSRDVAPIFYNKCVSCHRPGEVAPMSLITYRDVRPWASAIREKVTTRVMPPWHADRQYGSFRNDLSLTQTRDRHHRGVGRCRRERRQPVGTARRCRSSPRAGRSARPIRCSRCRPSIRCRPRATIDYQYFEVPTNFTEDRWMQAGEVRAGDRAHVHHIIVYVREPKPNDRPNVVDASGRSCAAGQTPAPAPARPPRHRRAGAFGGARWRRCDAGELGGR